MGLVSLYFRKQRRFLERITDIRLLYVLLLLSALMIVGMFIICYYRVVIVNEKPHITPLTAGQLEEAQAQNILVDCGLFIKNFTAFNINKNDFVLEGSIWFIFDPAKISKEIIDQFGFERGTILEKSSPLIETRDGKQFARYDIKLKFETTLNYMFFPFDQHRIDIIVVNKATTPQNLIYQSSVDALEFASDIYLKDWKLTSKEVRLGLTGQHLSDESEVPLTYERVIFSLHVAPASIKRLLLIFTPLFLIFFLGLFSLTFDVAANFGTILSMAVGSTTALFFYPGSIAGLSPTTDYFTVSDRVYLLLFIITIVTLGVQIYLLHFYQKIQRQTQLQEVLNYTAMSLNIIRSCFFIFCLVLMLGLLMIILP